MDALGWGPALIGRRVRARAAAGCGVIPPGLVSKIVKDGKVVEEAIQLGERISQFSKPVVGLCKESVNAGACNLRACEPAVPCAQERALTRTQGGGRARPCSHSVRDDVDGGPAL